MKEHLIRTYTFSELSCKAKDVAIENHRVECMNIAMAECADELRELIDKLEHIFSFKWLGKRCASTDEATGDRLWRKVNDRYSVYGYAPRVYTINNKRRCSKVLTKRICCPFTGICYDEDVSDFIEKWLHTPHPAEYRYLDFCVELVRLLRDISEMEEESTYDSLYVEGWLEGNDFEYLSDGRDYIYG